LVLKARSNKKNNTWFSKMLYDGCRS